MSTVTTTAPTANGSAPHTATANGTANGVHKPAPAPILTAEQKKKWAETGCLAITARDMWTPQELAALIEGVNLMDSWPDKAGHWMKYYEKKPAAAAAAANGDNKTAAAPAASMTESKSAPLTADEKMLQRIENFLQYNPGLQPLLRGKLEQISSELFEESAILYKEKINYKMPGGSGFEPHQDISAGWWMYGQSMHISALVTIDEATKENGCLEVVYGKHKQGKLGPDWKAIPDDVVKTLDWVLLPTKPGDCFFFDSYVPHRSGPNTTTKPRRVLYATYAKLKEGDLRDKYYADKRISFPPDIERLPGKDYAYKI